MSNSMKITILVSNTMNGTQIGVRGTGGRGLISLNTINADKSLPSQFRFDTAHNCATDILNAALGMV